MKLHSHAHSHHETRGIFSVLLAGFPQDESDNIASELDQIGWDSTVLHGEAEIETALVTTRFDVIVIDAKDLEVFAPHFIARIRSVQGLSNNMTIIAVDSYCINAFKEQLFRAGADLVIEKKADPKMYPTEISRAVSLRTRDSDVKVSKHQTAANAMVDRLVKNQLQDISSQYEFPVIVHVGKQIMILNDREQFLSTLSLYRSILNDEGLHSIVSTVIDDERCHSGNFKVCVKNCYFADDGRDIGTARIRYYGETGQDSCKIRMVEYLEWPCADRIADCEQLQQLIA